MKTQKLTIKKAQSGAITVVGGGVGAMASGAINAVTPQQFRLVGKIGHIALGVIIASSVSGKDEVSDFVKGTGIGLAVKPILDLGTEQLRKVLPVDTEKNTFIENLKAGFVGLKGTQGRALPTHLLGDFNADNLDFQDDFPEQEKKYNINF